MLLTLIPDLDGLPLGILETVFRHCEDLVRL